MAIHFKGRSNKYEIQRQKNFLPYIAIHQKSRRCKGKLVKQLCKWEVGEREDKYIYFASDLLNTGFESCPESCSTVRITEIYM